jgi:hypothetical protein
MVIPQSRISAARFDGPLARVDLLQSPVASVQRRRRGVGERREVGGLVESTRAVVSNRPSSHHGCPREIRASAPPLHRSPAVMLGTIGCATK